MNIMNSTIAYEIWLGKAIPLEPEELIFKHRAMSLSRFSFLRATFYRWVEQVQKNQAKLMNAPQTLIVGDIHIENFGTWRDEEGRLVWGVNDFDEACRGPYINDLLRLACSALVARKEDSLILKPTAICEAILRGYKKSIESGGMPLVLAEGYPSLRKLAEHSLKNPVAYWRKLTILPDVETTDDIRNMLRSALPDGNLDFRTVHRNAGLGSLGRPRVMAIAKWNGGWIAREVKAIATSAWEWQNGKAAAPQTLYEMALNKSVRSQDFHVQVSDGWVTRRLAPDCSRIELTKLPTAGDEEEILVHMGWETANIHLADEKSREAILKDLKNRKSGWLLKAAKEMQVLVESDFAEFARHQK